jgi:hypothetical protein
MHTCLESWNEIYPSIKQCKWSTLSKLNELDLVSSVKPQNLGVVEKLPSLTKLHLWDCHLDNLNALTNLTNLAALSCKVKNLDGTFPTLMGGASIDSVVYPHG